MEALVVVGQYRNQYHHKSSNCSPSRGFRDINCRFFQSDSGIRPNPLSSSFGGYSSVDEMPNQYSSPQKTPEPEPEPEPRLSPEFEELKHLRSSNGKSSAIPITSKEVSNENLSLIDEFAYTELWAGPAYSNSPPPSSLPMPKFSLRQKRSASFELPIPSLTNVTMRPFAKSAPPSPGRGDSSLYPSNSFLSIASATKDLRRILHLDVCDE